MLHACDPGPEAAETESSLGLCAQPGLISEPRPLSQGKQGQWLWGAHSQKSHSNGACDDWF